MKPSIAVEVCFNARVLSVSELARRSGMTTATLRFYERKGLLAPAGRAGGVRVYDDSALDRVATVSLLRQAGFTLAEIEQLIRPGGTKGHRMAMVHAKLSALERARADIDRAQAMLEHALECPDPDISVCPVFLREVRAHAERMAQGVPWHLRQHPALSVVLGHLACSLPFPIRGIVASATDRFRGTGALCPTFAIPVPGCRRHHPGTRARAFRGAGAITTEQARAGRP